MGALPLSPSLGLSQSIRESRDLLTDLQQQLATGKRVTTYGDVGVERNQLLSLRSELAQVGGYQKTVKQVDIRLDVMLLSLNRISELAAETKSDALEGGFELAAGGQTAYQVEVGARFDEMVGLLNNQIGDRHLFSGREVEQKPVLKSSEILDGVGAQAGFGQIADERRQADLGADGRGRLVIADGPASVTGAVVATPGDIGGAAPAQFTIDIGGNAQNFDVSDGGLDTLADLEAAIDTAFGADVAEIVGGNQLVITATNDTDTITVTDIDAGAAALAGLDSGVTTIPPATASMLGAVVATPGDIGGAAPAQFNINIGADTQTFDISDGAIDTLAALETAIDTAFSADVASIVNGNRLVLTATNQSDSISIVDIDAGAAALAGLTAGATASPQSAVFVAEDFDGSPFGYKLASAVTTATGIDITGPAGTPQQIGFDFNGANVNDGEFVRLTVDLPDGTQQDITLTARSSGPLQPGEFLTNADPAVTVANFQAALVASVETEAQRSLSAASLYAASNDFFDFDAANPPQRVDGPPFNTATALVDATANDTVFWYRGDDSATPARSSVVAKVDDNITTAYGARANEEAMRTVMQTLAALAVETFNPGDADAAERYTEIKQRAHASLSFTGGVQSADDMITELTVAKTTVGRAGERHLANDNLLRGFVEEEEEADVYEVSSAILSLQNRIEASLQVSVSLSRLSLVNFF